MIIATDATIRGCLDNIRKGDVTAVGVLADYLEEHEIAGAKLVRKTFVRYSGFIEFWQTRTDEQMKGRKYLRWERIAINRRAMCHAIGKLFGRKWKRKPLAAYTTGNKS